MIYFIIVTILATAYYIWRMSYGSAYNDWFYLNTYVKNKAVGISFEIFRELYAASHEKWNLTESFVEYTDGEHVQTVLFETCSDLKRYRRWRKNAVYCSKNQECFNSLWSKQIEENRMARMEGRAPRKYESLDYLKHQRVNYGR